MYYSQGRRKYCERFNDMVYKTQPGTASRASYFGAIVTQIHSFGLAHENLKEGG
jgi:hypothetical protein